MSSSIDSTDNLSISMTALQKMMIEELGRREHTTRGKAVNTSEYVRNRLLEPDEELAKLAKELFESATQTKELAERLLSYLEDADSKIRDVRQKFIHEELKRRAGF